MDDQTDETASVSNALQSQLERRFYAAMMDMVTVAAGCFAVVQAGSVLLPDGIRIARVPGLTLLGILFVLEALTGRSTGKFAMRLRVGRVGIGDKSGGRPTIPQTTVRAAARWFAPLLSLASMLTKDLSIAAILAGGALVLVICEIPACYITLFRRGGTIFDLIARTRVEPLRI
jgi:hypothetical protein